LLTCREVEGIIEFCSSYDYNSSSISTALSTLFEYERPAHSSENEVWETVTKTKAIAMNEQKSAPNKPKERAEKKTKESKSNKGESKDNSSSKPHKKKTNETKENEVNAAAAPAASAASAASAAPAANTTSASAAGGNEKKSKKKDKSEEKSLLATNPVPGKIQSNTSSLRSSLPSIALLTTQHMNVFCI
jgi:septal ring factor EnvC (AmiA/AmiB activator)